MFSVLNCDGDDNNRVGGVGGRILLTYTGRPRLSRVALRNVLRRWSRYMPVFLTTVGRLVIGAERAMDMLREKKN